jgi:hypothetical protein
MKLLKNLTRSPTFQKAVGVAAAEYLRLVFKTNRTIIEPSDIYERISKDVPIILAMWHGRHFMVPFVRRPEHRVKVLISRHRDGEINAITAERLGVGTIRGSGAHDGRYSHKGGVAAFRELMEALAQGYNVALTADIPKVSRVAGAGIVMLARMSGRPIYPVAVTTSRRMELNNWDRSELNLPFGRFVIAAGDPVRVPAEADKPAQEAARLAVEAGLNAASARARALAEGITAPETDALRPGRARS